MEYLLARTAHCCITQSNAIILDLQSGKYIGLNPKQTLALAQLVPGLASHIAYPSETTIEGGLDLARSLAASGVLTQDVKHGKILTPAATDRIERSILDEDLAVPPKIQLRDVISFAIAAIRAHLEIRFLSIRTILQRVQKRRSRRATHLLEDDVLKKRVWMFTRLRPWFYTSRDKCLIDSLALVHFLARSNLFPTWVLAVKTNPFAAHSWVQHHASILNGSVESAGDYAPIITV